MTQQEVELLMLERYEQRELEANNTYNKLFYPQPKSIFSSPDEINKIDRDMIKRAGKPSIKMYTTSIYAIYPTPTDCSNDTGIRLHDIKTRLYHPERKIYYSAWKCDVAFQFVYAQ